MTQNSEHPRFHIDPYTGSLVTRSHQYWRMFVFSLILHTMDYSVEHNPHNLLLKNAQLTGLSFTITGLWLLFYSFNMRRKRKAIIQ